MKKQMILALLALGLSTGLYAEQRKDYPQISFVAPSSGKTTVNPDQFVVLVIEGSFVSHENSPVPLEGVVGYVNGALKARSASSIAVHIREGIKYGEVVRALDTLSLTQAKSIGVSMVELRAGREL